MFNWLFGLKCPDCGARFTEQDQYCPSCGTDLNASNEQFTKGTAQQYLEKAQKAYEYGTRLESALSNCDQAIECDPSLAEAHNLRGLILDALGRSDEALASYREAIQIDPNLEEARENLKDAEMERQSKPLQEQSLSPYQDNSPKVITGVLLSAIAIAVVLGGFYFLYKVASPYFQPKTTIVFEPDRSQLATVDPADLEKTAELLTERAHFLGYTRVSFVVSDDGTIIGKVPSNIDVEDFTKRITAIGLLEFVDFGKTRVPEGTLVSTDLEHKYLVQTGDTKWHTIMTNAEIAEAYVSKDQMGRYAINFTLTAEGAEILHQYTTENIGSYLGIVLDKVVISIPSIQGAIPDGQGQISGGNFTEETANELAMLLRMTPLPIPLKVRSETNNNP